MKRKTIFAFLLFVFFTFNFYSLHATSSNHYIDAYFLKKYTWRICIDCLFNHSITFYPNNTYKNLIYGEGCSCGLGKYSISSNSKLILYPLKNKCTKNNDSMCSYNTNINTYSCFFSEDKNNIHYTKFFSCSNKDFNLYSANPKQQSFKIYLEQSKQLYGTVNYSLDGVKTMPISTGKISGKTIENVKIRQKPNLKAKYYSFSIFKGIGAAIINDDAVEKKAFIPKNTDITIYARTTFKNKVYKWNNYWYYVRINIQDKDKVYKRLYGWVYGEFIKFSEK